jgi:hypothetical protein
MRSMVEGYSGARRTAVAAQHPSVALSRATSPCRGGSSIPRNLTSKAVR